MSTYTSHYPTAHNSTYVKATSDFSDGQYCCYFATDPALSVTGSRVLNSWLSANQAPTNQRFHIDLGSAKIIRRIYLENGHLSGTDTITGAKNFTFWGSNSATAFAELTYATDTNWTQLTTDISVWAQHPAADTAAPQYAVVTNTTAYRYYAVKFADNYGSGGYIGIRRIELQTEDGFSLPSGFFFFMN